MGNGANMTRGPRAEVDVDQSVSRDRRRIEQGMSGDKVALSAAPHRRRLLRTA